MARYRKSRHRRRSGSASGRAITSKTRTAASPSQPLTALWNSRWFARFRLGSKAPSSTGSPTVYLDISPQEVSLSTLKGLGDFFSPNTRTEKNGPPKMDGVDPTATRLLEMTWTVLYLCSAIWFTVGTFVFSWWVWKVRNGL